MKLLEREASAPVWSALAALVTAGIVMVDSREFALDDAWIHLTYANNVRHARGVTYNPGEWETGFSSPLWLMILCAWPIGGDPVVAVKLLGALLHAATAWLCAAVVISLARARASLERPLPVQSLALLAGVLVATAPPLVEGATSGMEVPLSTASLAGLMLALVTGSLAAAMVTTCLAVLSRPEALVFVLVAASGFAWVHQQTRLLWVAAAGIAAMSAWTIYCLVTTGAPLPNAWYVKGGIDPMSGMSYVTNEVFPWQPWLVSVTGVVLLGNAVWQERRDLRWDLAVLLLSTVICTLAVVATRPLHPGVQFFERRYFAFVPLAFSIAAALGLVGVQAFGKWLAFALVVPVAIVTGLQLADVLARVRALEQDTFALHTSIAMWARRNLSNDAVIAVEGAGALRFHTPATMTIVDLVGLNDHRAAALHDQPTAKLCHFVRRQPTHFVVPIDWMPIYQRVFELATITSFYDPEYTQVAPPRPLEIVVAEVRGVTPEWQARCAS